MYSALNSFILDRRAISVIIIIMIIIVIITEKPCLPAASPNYALGEKISVLALLSPPSGPSDTGSRR